jgi:protein SDA1
MDYFKFMAHVSSVYKTQIASFLSGEILDVLQQYYAILHPEIRMCLVTCLKIMRGKDVIPAAAVLPVFLKLFKC